MHFRSSSYRPGLVAIAAILAIGLVIAGVAIARAAPLPDATPSGCARGATARK